MRSPASIALPNRLRICEGQPENTAATAVDSTLTCILGRMAQDGRREVTWDEMLKTAG
jgi:hypothetical protein